jgi:hypothetical protein
MLRSAEQILAGLITAYLITAVLIVFLSYAPPLYAQVTFTEYTVDNSFAGPGGVYACDIDGDDDKDILGAAINDNEIAWWRNDGGDPITWTKQTIGANFAGAIFVFAEYVDSDEFIDVLGTSWDGNEIAWWRNDGGNPITWTKQTIAGNFTNAHEVFASDIDGDGNMDVLGAGAGNHDITWWRNDGGEPIQWTAQTIDGNFTGARSVYAHDIDGDEDKDVLGAALLSNEITLWLNDGGDPIEWTEVTISSNFAGAHMVRVYDMDTDGDPDILGVAYTARDIAWWRNDGGEPITWTQQTIAGNFIGAVIASAADVDGDEDIDVIGTGQDASELSWWRNDGGEPIIWTKQFINTNFPGVWPSCVIDLDGDEDIDIIAGGYNANEIRWWKNDTAVGIADHKSKGTPFPTARQLSQNYPNPFNPTTTIEFSLEVPSLTRLSIYDLHGKFVNELIREHLDAGLHSISWNGTDRRGRAVGSGIYFYKLTAGDLTEMKRMIILK